MVQLRNLLIGVLLAAGALAQSQGPAVRRELATAPVAKAEWTSPGAQYRAIFGPADGLKNVVRFGQLTIAPGGTSASVAFPDQEQVYIVLEGAGVLVAEDRELPLRKDDFVYVPPAVKHSLVNRGQSPARVLVAGYRVQPEGGIHGPLRANMADVSKQQVEGHPPTTLYQLLVGDRQSKRDKLAAGLTVSSVFVMEFAPGGTNKPHRHHDEEEIYLVLNGKGDMVAGSDAKGGELRHSAKAGDAYFFPPNCLVGFYAKTGPQDERSHILAFRSKAKL